MPSLKAIRVYRRGQAPLVGQSPPSLPTARLRADGRFAALEDG